MGELQSTKEIILYSYIFYVIALFILICLFTFIARINKAVDENNKKKVMTNNSKAKNFFDKNIWIKNWAFILFCIQAEYVIVRYADKVDRLEQCQIDNLSYHKAFINCFYDLGCNPLKTIPDATNYNNYVMKEAIIQKDSISSFIDAKGNSTNKDLKLYQ